MYDKLAHIKHWRWSPLGFYYDRSVLYSWQNQQTWVGLKLTLSGSAAFAKLDSKWQQTGFIKFVLPALCGPSLNFEPLNGIPGSGHSTKIFIECCKWQLSGLLRHSIQCPTLSMQPSRDGQNVPVGDNRILIKESQNNWLSYKGKDTGKLSLSTFIGVNQS